MMDTVIFDEAIARGKCPLCNRDLDIYYDIMGEDDEITYYEVVCKHHPEKFVASGFSGQFNFEIPLDGRVKHVSEIFKKGVEKQEDDE